MITLLTLTLLARFFGLSLKKFAGLISFLIISILVVKEIIQNQVAYS